WARCLGSVHAVHTSARGASNTRVPMIDRGSRSRSRLFLALTLFLLRLQLVQVIPQSIEALVPEAAIGFEPVVNILEGTRFDPAGAPLRRAAARDEAGALPPFVLELQQLISFRSKWP